MISDFEGYPIKEGATVMAWWDGNRFAATVKAIKPSDLGDDGPRRIVLVRDHDHAEVERSSDQVVVVGDDEVLPETNLTATVETRIGDERAVIRLSGRAGLQPAEIGQAAAGSRTQQLRDMLMAVPQVTDVAIVATDSNRKRNIVVHWEVGADPTAVSQRAWQAVSEVIPDAQLRRAFWQ